MKTTQRNYTVRQLVDGFVYNELLGKGLFGLSGNLVIQPEYQRSYVYSQGKKDAAVIRSLLNGHPIGVCYFRVKGATLDILDGQQRITSIGRFVTNKFAVKINGHEQFFMTLSKEDQNIILDSEILVYECEGTESDLRAWFEVINTAGVPLSDQELRNCLYSGPFATAARAVYSDPLNASQDRWSTFVKGDPMRQGVLEVALRWVAERNGQTIDEYMAAHCTSPDISEVTKYFTAVIDWATAMFSSSAPEMRGLQWNRLYEKYHATAYNPTTMAADVKALLTDPSVTSPKGVYEYLLSGRTKPELLHVRMFDARTKVTTYHQQTAAAQGAGVSNCAMCAVGTNANKTRIYKVTEMEADHVTAWSKGGSSLTSNCELLCTTHNRAKGNR